MKEANIGHGNVVLTTGPLYVLVGIKGAKGDETTDVCLLSNILTGAISKEHGWWDDGDAQRKAFEVAMTTPNRVFSFRNREALTGVMPSYTPQQLNAVRRKLAGYSREGLLREAQVDLMKSPNEQSALTKIYRHGNGKHLSVSRPLRNAVAHVLLEHGILVGDDQESETLYVPEDWK